MSTSNNQSDNIEFPIVVKLLKPLELKDGHGNIVESFDACIIASEPEYGQIKKIAKVAPTEQLSAFIEAVTNIPKPLIDKLGARDVARIEEQLMVFFPR